MKDSPEVCVHMSMCLKVGDSKPEFNNKQTYKGSNIDWALVNKSHHSYSAKFLISYCYMDLI